MAENIDVTPGTGATIAADDVAGVKYQQIKLIDATADSTAPTGIAASPLQVSLANHGANATAVKVDGSAATQPVSGTVAVTNAGITSIDGKVTACNTGAVVLAAGTAEIGKLAAGTAEIGKLGAGTALIGKVDLDKVAGASVAVSNGTADASIRVTVASDSTGQIKLAAGTAEIGKLAAGTAEIGKLGAGTAEIGKLAAGTANIGDVDVLSFLNGKTILRAAISGATSGDNTIVTADATKKIKVLSLFLVAATAVTVRFESAAGGTALTGVMSIGATGGFVLPAPADPTNHWFETTANQLLNMELGGAVQVSGAITYYLEA